MPDHPQFRPLTTKEIHADDTDDLRPAKQPTPVTGDSDGQLTSLEIARKTPLRAITDVAADIGIGADLLEPCGEFVAKIKLDAIPVVAPRPKAKYVVVTAVTPTPLGEGKTTTTIGLAQGMGHIGKRATAAIRQASMGPTFGIKGGAAGGGYSQAAPFEALNLHLTGDMHAVTAAHNTLSAMLDNHLYQGNDLGIDPYTITWRRVLDVNDRTLRNVVIGLGSKEDGLPRQAGFDITAASEVMAILALSTSLQDMRGRLGRIVVGFTADAEPVTVEQLGGRCHGCDHAGCHQAQPVADPGELAGPGSRRTVREHCPRELLGARRLHRDPRRGLPHHRSRLRRRHGRRAFLQHQVSCFGPGARRGRRRRHGARPKAHSGSHRIIAGRPLPPALMEENPDEVRIGGANLRKQIQNVLLHGVTPVVAINAFPGDFNSEYAVIREIADSMGVRSAVTSNFRDGGSGATDLAEAVVAAAEEPSDFHFLYPDDAPLRTKIEAIATRVYGAEGADFLPAAAAGLELFERNGLGSLPICIAKTHLSLSSDPKLKGAPTGWRLPVREVRASVGAGFIYAICGDMRTMPGLSSHPGGRAHRYR